MLLDPAVVDARVDDIEDEDDDVEDDRTELGAAAESKLFFGGKRESDLLVGMFSNRGADADKPLSSFELPELKLLAVPLAVFAPDPDSLDKCIWAT